MRHWVVVGVWLLATGPVRAQETTPPAAPPDEPTEPAQPRARPAPAKPQPWEVGITPKQRARTNALLAAGNDLFVVDKKYDEALAKYRAALAIWDHPQIHFNITRAYIKLDKPVKAHDHVVAALRYGPDGLGEYFEQATNYKQLLDKQVATLEVRCDQAGVTITVDGQPFLSCPGTKSAKVLAGSHQIVGKKPGPYLTLTRELEASSGKTTGVDIRVVTLDEATVTVRRWDRWKPWAVVGGGAAAGGLGILLELRARSTRDEYAEALADNCSETPCPADFRRDTLDSAKLQHGLAVSAMVLGGAAVVTGIAGVILNRPREVLPDEATEPQGPRVVPAVSASGAGVSISGTF